MTKSIYNEIKDLPLSDNIKERANNIFQQMQIYKRKERRKLVIFASLFYAHKELHKAIDPEHLLSLLGLNKNDAVKSMKICREMNYQPPNYVFTVYDFIDYHLHILGIYKGNDNIKEFARQILQGDPSLDDCKPQYLSQIIIYQYFYIFNYHELLNNLRKSTLKCPTSQASVLRARIEDAYRNKT